MLEDSNRINNELIDTSDVQAVEKILSEAPPDKKENWDNIKKYLEETAPKALSNVKKLGKLIEFLIKRK